MVLERVVNVPYLTRRTDLILFIVIAMVSMMEETSCINNTSILSTRILQSQ